jgi:iron complex transport system ATP-binding protein
LAAAYADRVLVMSEGRVVADGPPDDVLTGERLTAVYGHPVVDARHPTQGWHYPVAARADTSASLFEPVCPLMKGHP